MGRRDKNDVINISNKLKILVIDDEASILKLLRLWLIDYECLFAEDVDTAFQIIDTTSIDIIITDFRMKASTGFSIAQKVLGRLPVVPVIMITGEGSKDLAINCFKRGVFDYLEKPFSKEDILDSIARAARLRGTHQKLDDVREELRRYSENLSQNLETKDQLLRVLSHDLSNSLQIVSMCLEIDMNDITIAKIKRIVNEQITLIKLVKEKEMAKVNETHTASLSKVRDYLNILFESRLSQKNMRLVFEGSWEGDVSIEESILNNSVLGNIISNSIKFSKMNSEIILNCQFQNNVVILTIRDFGVGMNAKDLQALFSHGNRTSKLGTMGEQGTGLGTTIIKYQIEKYGGRVSVLSHENLEGKSPFGMEYTIELAIKGDEQKYA